MKTKHGDWMKNVAHLPRKVPFLTKLYQFAGGPGSWWILLMALMLKWSVYMGAQATWIEATKFKNPQTIRGIVTEVNELETVLDDIELIFKKPEVILAFQYEWEGNTYEGYSWSHIPIYAEKDDIPVEININNPQLARIKDCRYARFHKLILIQFFFILLFFWRGLKGWSRSVATVAFWENGPLVMAHLDRKNPDKTSNMNNAYWPIRYEYVNPQGETCVLKKKAYDLEGLDPRGPLPVLLHPEGLERKGQIMHELVAGKIAAIGMDEPGRWNTPAMGSLIYGAVLMGGTMWLIITSLRSFMAL